MPTPCTIVAQWTRRWAAKASAPLQSELVDWHREKSIRGERGEAAPGQAASASVEFGSWCRPWPCARGSATHSWPSSSGRHTTGRAARLVWRPVLREADSVYASRLRAPEASMAECCTMQRHFQALKKRRRALQPQPRLPVQRRCEIPHVRATGARTSLGGRNSLYSEFG